MRLLGYAKADSRTDSRPTQSSVDRLYRLYRPQTALFERYNSQRSNIDLLVAGMDGKLTKEQVREEEDDTLAQPFPGILSAFS